MTLIELIIMALFDIVEYMIISNKLIYNDKIHNYKIDKALLGISILVFSVIAGTFSWILQSDYKIIVLGMLMTSMIFFIYRRTIKESIYLYIISTVIVSSVQLISIVLLKIARIDVGYNFTSGLISQMIAMTLVIIINIYVPINTIFKYINKDNKIFKILVFNMFIISFSILLYWYIDINGILQNLITITVIIVGIIIINFILLKNGVKNELQEKQLKIYEVYLPYINELISEIRKRQNILKKHESIIDSDIIKQEDSVEESKKS